MRFWYTAHYSIWAILLLPLSFLFKLLICLRRYFYTQGWLTRVCFKIPIIVVGNITVGGTGKTPTVMWLTNFLRQQGYQPGIVSRGWGGKEAKAPIAVTAQSDPQEVGDEAVLMAKNLHVPIVVCKDRVAAVAYLLKNFSCQVIIADDGLQHYHLQRDIEIVLIDGVRKFGNGLLLPAGPLREPVTRLKQADFTIMNGGKKKHAYHLDLKPMAFVALGQDQHRVKLEYFRGKKVHAVAALGNPERFFSLLHTLGISFIPHRFSDHYIYRAIDLNFKDDLPIIMTEKDAVKCMLFAKKNFWYLATTPSLSKDFGLAFMRRLQEVKK